MAAAGWRRHAVAATARRTPVKAGRGPPDAGLLGVSGGGSQEVSGAKSWVVPFQKCDQSTSQPNRPTDLQSNLHGPTKYAKRLSPPRGLVPRPRGAKKRPKTAKIQKFAYDLLLGAIYF